MGYISPEGLQALRRYQYRGGDTSPIYKYVLTPMNNVLINYIPMWMAPNLVTMTGTMIALSSNFMLYILAPAFDVPVPVWAYVVDAFASFAYQTLDNLDGKQARRTGSSSPLGLLFDHGCDAFNSTTGALSQAVVMQLGPTWQLVALWQVVCTPFLFTTLEELHTGELILPIVNGPTEGILVLVVAKLLTAYMGPEIWTQACSLPYAGGLKNNTAFLMFLWIGSHFVILHNTLTIYKSKHRKDSMWTVCHQLLPYGMFQLGTMLWVYVSDIEETHPCTLMWWIGLLFALIVMNIMLAHITESHFNPWITPFLAMCPFAAYLTVQMLGGSVQAADEVHSRILYMMFAIVGASYVHFVSSVINDCCKALDINCFSIKKKTA